MRCTFVVAGGAAALVPAFTIQKAADARMLPSASTCFNLLKLPPYASTDIMNTKLKLSVNEGSVGFAFH